MQHWKDFSTLPAFGLEVIVELEDNKIISVKLNSNNKDDKQNNTEDDKTQNNIDSDTKQDDIKSNETNNKPEIKEIPITDNSTINLDEEEKKPLEENKVTKVLDKVEIIKARGYIQVDKNIEECIYNPIPVPLDLCFVVKYGSKTFSINSFFIPPALSQILTIEKPF